MNPAFSSRFKNRVLRPSHNHNHQVHDVGPGGAGHEQRAELLVEVVAVAALDEAQGVEPFGLGAGDGIGLGVTILFVLPGG